MSDTRFKSINIRQLVAKVDRKPEIYPVYTFSNGRQFYGTGARASTPTPNAGLSTIILDENDIGYRVSNKGLDENNQTVTASAIGPDENDFNYKVFN